MLKRFLFETRLGQRMLGLLEKAGLAVVSAEWLAGLNSDAWPTPAGR